MTSQDQENFNQLFELGKQAFDKGLYRQSLDYLIQGEALVSPLSRDGAQVQIWLMTVYQALGKNEEAIAICQKLITHPDFTIRKQAKDLLFILQAPRLNRPKEWMTEIPDLSKVSEEENRSVYETTEKKTIAKSKINSFKEDSNTSQISDKNNNFFSFALSILLLIMVTFFFLNK
jgi:tetratricopeptide (TPR) repeat protein